MKNLYPVLLLLVLLFSCEKKSAVTPISPLPPVDSNVIPVFDTDVFIGSYYDSATGDNMSWLSSYRSADAVLYVIHSTSNQIVCMKKFGLFIGVPQQPYVSLQDTFTVNNQQYYVCGSANRSGGSAKYGTFNQTTPDIFWINADSLYYSWGYTSIFDCYDPADHSCAFSGIKQQKP